MGDPKKQRKKYSKPLKMWDSDRIKRENILVKDYGLKNKKEIWKLNHVLKKYQMQAKRLLASEGKQELIEKKQLMDKLSSLGIIKQSDDLNTILGLSVKDFLNRRLQSVVFTKKMARSLKQARQMVTHEHVSIAGNKITIPSYLVSIEEEDTVVYAPNSSFKKDDHPERAIEKVKEIPDDAALKDKKEDDKPKKIKKDVKEKKDTLKEGDKKEKPKEEKVEEPKKAEEKVEEKKEEKSEESKKVEEVVKDVKKDE